MSLRQYQHGRLCRVSVHNAPPEATALSSNTFEDLPSSSQSSHISPSDSEGMDLAPINSLSKRKATLPPTGSLRAQKSARTNSSHGPGRVVMQSAVTSGTQAAFQSRTGATSSVTKKKRKVLLPRNRELLHSLTKPKSGSRTFTKYSHLVST